MKSHLRLIIGIVALSVIAGVIWNWAHRGGATGTLTVKVMEGPFRSELLIRGEIQAVNSINITPRTHGKLADLIPEGTVVEKDQPIAWMETEEYELDVERNRIDLEISQKELEKAEENARLQDHLNLLSVEESRAQLEYQKNQLASARSKLEKTRRLVEAEVSPRKALDDAELDVLSQELQLQNAELSLEKAIKNRDSQVEIQKADVTNAHIDLEKSRAALDKALNNLKNAEIKAPEAGIVMYKNIWKGSGTQEKVAIGDQVGPWQPFLEIPDLSELEVVTKVDEIDISRLKEGRTASIGLDAFPELTLHGSVTKIAALAEETGSLMEGRGRGASVNRKVFEVHISIDDAPGELRPGITARVSVLLYETAEALYVPIEAVFTEADDRVVYVSGFAGPEKVKVLTGEWNAQYVTIVDGLKAGQKIWLTRPDSI